MPSCDADHPLAVEAEVRLRDCLDQTHVIPRADMGGCGHCWIDAAARGSRPAAAQSRPSDSFEFMPPLRYCMKNAIAFQIPNRAEIWGTAVS